MNAGDDGLTDFDLYVRSGSPPTLTDFDCKADGPNQYGFCEFSGPSPGTWYVLVNRYFGSGEYQVTVSTFGADCGLPENEGAPCDDGNGCTGPDICHLGSCTGPVLADGTSCSDGAICTLHDACQTGVCVGGTSPALGCKLPAVAGRSFLRIKNRIPDDGDRLVWRWTDGSATTKAEFGDPVASAHALCVYDEAGGVPKLVVAASLPTGAKWREMDDGYKYRNLSRKADGINIVRLREGPDAKSGIVLKGKKGGLNLGPATPFHQDTRIRVQLVGESECWEAIYSTNFANNGTNFEARSD